MPREKKVKPPREVFATFDTTKGTETFDGMRRGLFQAAFKTDENTIKTYTLDVQYAIAQALFKLGREARDKARRDAPKQSGALAASIYVTSPASRAELKEAITGGKGLIAHKMKRHSGNYLKALSAAGKKNGYEIPGMTDEGIGGSIVIPRTQRLKKNTTQEDIRFALNELAPENVTYKEFNSTFPFNPLGTTGQTAFYVGLGVGMYYAAWVEYGTTVRKATPYFTPAAKWMTSEAPGRVAMAMSSVSAKKGGTGK